MAVFCFLAKIRAMDVLLFYFFIIFFLSLTVLGLCCCMDFSVAWSVGVTLQLQCMNFSQWWLLLLHSPGSRAWGLQWLWHVDSVIAAPRFQSTGSVVLHKLSCSQECGNFWLRDWTCVSCIGRQILYHWATREALGVLFKCYWPPSGSSSLDLQLAYMVCQAMLDA